MDDLNAYTLSFLYEAFSVEVVFGLARRLVLHFIPKYGSWFDIAEIGLSALAV